MRSLTCLMIITSSGINKTNCSVSSWTAWSPCSNGCGSGSHYRNRTVMTQAYGGGDPCPPLSEVCSSFLSSLPRPSRFISESNVLLKCDVSCELHALALVCLEQLFSKLRQRDCGIAHSANLAVVYSLLILFLNSSLEPDTSPGMRPTAALRVR